MKLKYLTCLSASLLIATVFLQANASSVEQTYTQADIGVSERNYTPFAYPPAQQHSLEQEQPLTDWLRDQTQ